METDRDPRHHRPRATSGQPIAVGRSLPRPVSKDSSLEHSSTPWGFEFSACIHLLSKTMALLRFNTYFHVFGYGTRDPQSEVLRIEIMRTDRSSKPPTAICPPTDYELPSTTPSLSGPSTKYPETINYIYIYIVQVVQVPSLRSTKYRLRATE